MGRENGGPEEIRHQIEGDAIAKRGTAPLSLGLGFGTMTFSRPRDGIKIIVIIRVIYLAIFPHDLRSIINRCIDGNIIVII